jgi:hypothetical protein
MGRSTYATACASATASGTATARRDSLPALLADQVTISGVQTVHESQLGVQWKVEARAGERLTIMSSLGEDQSREMSGLVVRRGTEEDGETNDQERPAELGRPATVAEFV